MVKLLFVFSVEGKAQRAEPAQFDVDACLVQQFYGESRVHPVGLKAKSKEIIVGVSLHLRRENSGRRPRSLATKAAPFEYRHHIDAAPFKLACDRQTDDASAD